MNTISYDDYRQAGFREVWGIGDTESLRRFCKGERLLLTKTVDIETALYSKERPEGFVIGIELEEYEKEYIGYKLGCRGFVLFMDGTDNPLIDYFVKREKEYWDRAREIGRQKRKESGGFVGGTCPYGYYVTKKKLYVDKYESFIVKFAFYRYSQGCKFSGIAKELNLRGFKNRNGNPFKSGSIESIIKNKRLYQGYFTHNGEEIKGDFRGILEDSEELLTEDWKKRVFDAETEAKIAEHEKRLKGDRAVPLVVHPYIIADDRDEAKKKVRRIKRGIKRSV